MKLVIKFAAIVAIIIAGLYLGIRILRQAPQTVASAEHGEAAAPEYERGPHG